MTEPVVLAKTPSVSWIDAPKDIDERFLSEVPLIPEKAEQAILISLVESATDRLFELTPPNPWAVFRPFRGYFTGIKRLFGKKVLADFDVAFAVEILDNILENNVDNEVLPEEGEKIYEMLYSLQYLNETLEIIRLKLLSFVKT